MKIRYWNQLVPLIAVAACIVVAATSTSAQENANDIRWSPSFGFNGLDERVRAVALLGNRVVVGGDFTAAGHLAANHVAVWDAQSNRWDSLGVGFNAPVHALAVAGGDLYAGGEFTRSAGRMLNHIARWNPTTREWDEVGSGANTGVDGIVRAIAVAGDTIVIGGDFSTAGDVAANRIARFDRGTNGWSAYGTGLRATVGEPRVEVIGIHNGAIYVGGRFDTAGTIQAPNVARYVDNQWKSLGTGIENGSLGPIQAFAFDDSIVYVGGNFTGVGTTEAVGVVTWNPADGSWRQVIRPTEGLRGECRALALADGRLYVGGIFDGAGFIDAKGIVSLVNGAWRALDTGVIGEVEAIVPISGGGVLVAGSFTRAGAVATGRIAIWDGTAWSGITGDDGAGVNGTVRALAIDPASRRVYAAGTFDAVGTIPVGNIAVWDGASRMWVTNLGRVAGTVNAMVLHNGRIYIGGSFTAVDTVAASNVASWDIATRSWTPFGSGFENGVDGTVRAITIQGSNVVLGGDFTLNRDGVVATNIAAWNPETEVWNGLGDGTNGVVRAVAVDGGFLYAGGDFTSVDNVAANFIARYKISTRIWENLGTGAGDVVRSLVSFNGGVVVGGDFRTAGTVGARGIARFVTEAGYWDLYGDGIAGASPSVTAVAVGTDSTIYATGRFEAAGSAPTRNIARWSPRERSWHALGNGIDGSGSIERGLAIASNMGSLVVGGNITRAGNTYSRGIAVYDAGSLSTPGAGSTVVDQRCIGYNEPGGELVMRLPHRGTIRLDIFTLLGERIVLLADDEREAGEYRIPLDGLALQRGAHLVRLIHDGRSEVMILPSR